MADIYLTELSVFILVALAVIAVFVWTLVRMLLRNAQHEGRPHLWRLAAMLVCMGGMLTALLLIASSLPAFPSPYAWGRIADGAAIVFYIEFVYHYPRYRPDWRREYTVARFLALAWLLWMIVSTAMTYLRWSSRRSPADYAVELAFVIWGMYVLACQSILVTSEDWAVAGGRSRGSWYSLLHPSPGGVPPLILLLIATGFLLATSIALVGSLGWIALGLQYFLLVIITLVGLTAFGVAYLNHFPATTTLLDKVTIPAVLIAAITCSTVTWLLMPGVAAGYWGPIALHDTLLMLNYDDLGYRIYLHERMLPVVVLALVGTGSIVVAVHAVFRRMVIAPLQRLQKGVQQVDGGDFSVRIAVSYPDEIGQLTTIVNRMAADLETLAATQAEVSALRQMDQLRAQLIGNISHELRTPMSVIQTAGTTLQAHFRQLPHAMEQQVLQAIVEQSERMDQLTTELLDMSRIQKGQLHLRFTSIDLGRFLEETVRHKWELLRAIQRRTRADALLNFVESIDGTLAKQPADIELQLLVQVQPIITEVDAQRIRQVIENLLENAVKYSPAGGCIAVTLALAGTDHCMISVSDQGIGISQAEQSLIFDSFYRSEHPVVAAQKGIGLGLPICQEIVRAHGGTIAVESVLGQGSVFRVELPLEQSRMPNPLVAEWVTS